MERHLCEYGCGQEAKYKFKNGRWCCSKFFTQCPVMRYKSEDHKKKIGSGNKGKHNIIPSEKTKELMSKAKKGKTYEQLYGKKKAEKIKNIRRKRFEGTNHPMFLTISRIKNKYPFFYKIEELRYNPDKPEEKEIQVHCKNHNCSNSKEQGGWFTPTYIQLYERIRHLEKDYGNGGCYFYCCNNCKNECPLYNIHFDPFQTYEFQYTQEEYNIWRQVVLKQDKYQCQKCGSKENLHCHHILPVKTHPYLALDPDNGIVLCNECHYKFGHKDECSTGNLANKVCNKNK